MPNSICQCVETLNCRLKANIMDVLAVHTGACLLLAAHLEYFLKNSFKSIFINISKLSNRINFYCVFCLWIIF